MSAVWVKLNAFEPVVRRCSVKKVSLNVLQNSQGNTCARASFLIKLQAWRLRPAILLKKRLVQVFSCEFCGIFKNTSVGCFWRLSCFWWIAVYNIYSYRWETSLRPCEISTHARKWSVIYSYSFVILANGHFP